MAAALGAVAGGLAAAEVRKGKRTRQQIVRKLKTTYQLKLALPESRSLGSSGFVIHLMV
jgi:hypothetical protein